MSCFRVIGRASVLLTLPLLCLTPDREAHAQDVDWRLHNLDLAGSRYSELDQIDRGNVHTLTPRWLFQTGVIDGVSNQSTPIVVDGTMFVTDSRGSVYALDAANGHLLWIYDVTDLLGGGRREGYIFRHRGATYENGVVYSAAGSFIFALDAETGEPLEGFGENGQASVILDVLRQRYPDVETAISMGYWFTSAPQIHDGVALRGVHPQREPDPGRTRAGRGHAERRGPVAFQHHSPGRERSRLGRRGGRPGSAAAGRGAASGRPRPSIRSWGCSTSPWGTPLATPPSARV